MVSGKIKVLFVCIHNSARSQMAEAYLNTLAPEKFHAESAGLEPGKLNPNVVKVLLEEGIDITENKTKSVYDKLRAKELYDYVITVCDATSGERCPYFPGGTVRLHWEFPDPSSFKDTQEEILIKTRSVRDMIKDRVKKFINGDR